MLRKIITTINLSISISKTYLDKLPFSCSEGLDQIQIEMNRKKYLREKLVNKIIHSSKIKNILIMQSSI